MVSERFGDRVNERVSERVPDLAVIEAAGAWLADDPDPHTARELKTLIEARSPELAVRFAGRLQFGTAGLRGPLQAGPMGMNRVTVIRAAAGLARHLLATVDGAALGNCAVVIGCDARHNSDVFALDTARVVAGAGMRALLLPSRLPTPVLAFAVRHLGCVAGVMVTASHNPPGDNGYKVYLGDGAQIVPPHDEAIAAAIDAVGAVREVALGAPDDPRIVRLDNSAVDAYLAAVTKTGFVPRARAVRVAYTPLHGVGRDTLLSAFDRAGFPPPAVVREQADPDPDFPTVPFPNPEEPGAMDLLLALAASSHADLAIANDPDADRLGAAIPTPDGGWRALSGNEIGWLLADHVLHHTSGKRLVATTLVSSTMLRAMAAAEGAEYAETLTGFKWIARAIIEHPETQFVFGYEQALGYLVGDVVRDKDGIGAALVLSEVAALARQEGVTLQQRLDGLAERFGRHVTAERSLHRDPQEQADLMARLRVDPPAAIGGKRVITMVDRTDGNVLLFSLDGGVRLLVRPSGTEPKLKLYAETVGGDPGPVLDAMEALLADA
jgi:phosphomannomutase